MGRSYAALLANAAPLDDGQPTASTSTAELPRNPKFRHDGPLQGDAVFEAFLPLEPNTSRTNESINISTLLQLAGNEAGLTAMSERDTMPLDLCPTTPPAAAGQEEEEEPEISPSPSSGVFHTRTLDLPLELPANRRTPSPRPSTSTAARSRLDTSYLLRTDLRTRSDELQSDIDTLSTRLTQARSEADATLRLLRRAEESPETRAIEHPHVTAMVNQVTRTRPGPPRSEATTRLREAQASVELELERSQNILGMLQNLSERQRVRREEAQRVEGLVIEGSMPARV